jgi:hypothetical protein
MSVENKQIKFSYGTKDNLALYETASLGEVVFITNGMVEGDRKVLEVAVCTAEKNGTNPPVFEYVTDEVLLQAFVALNNKIFIETRNEVDILKTDAELDMDGNKITGLADGEEATDAATVGQLGGLETRIELLEDIDLTSYVAKAGDTMSGALNMGGNKITGLSNGEALTDAATVGQVTTLISNLGTVMKFLGGVTEIPTSKDIYLVVDGKVSTEKTTAVAGDVVVIVEEPEESETPTEPETVELTEEEAPAITDIGKEFIFDGSNWLEIGHEGVGATLEALTTQLNSGAYMPKWNTF